MRAIIPLKGRRAKMRICIAVGAVSITSFATTCALADDLSTINSRVDSQLLANAPSTSTVQGYMNSLQSNGSWADVSYSSTAQTDWSPGTHLSRMASMAEIWDDPSSSLITEPRSPPIFACRWITGSPSPATRPAPQAARDKRQPHTLQHQLVRQRHLRPAGASARDGHGDVRLHVSRVTLRKIISLMRKRKCPSARAKHRRSFHRRRLRLRLPPPIPAASPARSRP